MLTTTKGGHVRNAMPQMTILHLHVSPWLIFCRSFKCSRDLRTHIGHSSNKSVVESEGSSSDQRQIVLAADATIQKRGHPQLRWFEAPVTYWVLDDAFLCCVSNHTYACSSDKTATRLRRLSAGMIDILNGIQEFRPLKMSREEIPNNTFIKQEFSLNTWQVASPSLFIMIT